MNEQQQSLRKLVLYMVIHIIHYLKAKSKKGLSAIKKIANIYKYIYLKKKLTILNLKKLTTIKKKTN